MDQQRRVVDRGLLRLKRAVPSRFVTTCATPACMNRWSELVVTGSPSSDTTSVGPLIRPIKRKTGARFVKRDCVGRDRNEAQGSVWLRRFG